MKKHLFFIQYSAPSSMAKEIAHCGIVYPVVGRQGGSFHLRTRESYDHVLGRLASIGARILRTRTSTSVPKVI